MKQQVDFDVIVTGAGFGGMYMLHKLRKLGLRTRVFEAGDGVGGTWYWNRYPGARCDTESVEYSYSFSDDIQQTWEWSERYPTQPEILRYANWVADRLDLKRDIQFNTYVDSARFDDDSATWTISTSDGIETTSRFLVMATGCLSTTNLPNIPGVESFAGRRYHTGSWPHEPVDFSNQTVAIIGTGSSAIQSIPIVAKQASHLYVFQRTANYSVPAHNGPLEPERVKEIKANYEKYRHEAKHSRRGYFEDTNPVSALDVSDAERRAEFARRWKKGGLGYVSSFSDLLSNSEANEHAAEFVRQRIREIVKDPETAEKLAPDKYPIGTKRLCVDSGYYETFNRENVTLIDSSDEPITEITPAGIRTSRDQYEVDALILATGFDAMTGTLKRIDVRGRNGRQLRDHWRDGPLTYLGLAISGFPNLFTITGPGSPSVLSNMMVSIEQNVEWIADLMEYATTNQLEYIEATDQAESEWTDHVVDVASGMLFSQGNSWWKGANVEGKPTVFMPYAGGVGRYRAICDEVASNGYSGFRLSHAPVEDHQPA
jgi:cyclohexanone monooxygenase